MVRRWLIRGLALALLTLCVVVWVGSYFASLSMSLGPRGWRIDPWIDSGSAGCEDMYNPRYGTIEPYWKIRPPDFMSIEQDYSDATHHVAGFAYHRFSTGLRRIIFPIWFPTLLSALLLWLVWRKTRPACNGRGFPVEVAGKEAATP
jgi:hypothetical protein